MTRRAKNALTENDRVELAKFEVYMKLVADGRHVSDAYAEVYGGATVLYDAETPYVPGSLKRA